MYRFLYSNNVRKKETLPYFSIVKHNSKLYIEQGTRGLAMGVVVLNFEILYNGKINHVKPQKTQNKCFKWFINIYRFAIVFQNRSFHNSG